MLTVVIGPPCAGKSTYIRRMSSVGDVLVDYDALARALGSPHEHDAPRAVADVAFHARKAAIDRCLARGHPAFVIHSNPTPAQIRAYRDAQARLVLLDPGQDECLARAERDARPPETAERIRQWYASPPNLAADWSQD